MVVTRRPRRTTKPARVADAPRSFAERLASHMRDKYPDEDGTGTAVVLSGNLVSRVTDFVSSQNPMMDLAIGHPGFPVGRMSLIFGKTSTGKTTCCWHVLAETQRRGGVAVLIDAEYALDPERAVQLGINPDELVVFHPNTIEDAIKQIQELATWVREEPEMKDVLLTIVFDSVAGLPTKMEEEAEIDTYQVAAHAKVLSKTMRKTIRMIADHKICLIIVNQYREKIGGTAWTDNKTMLAETPLSFASTVSFEIAASGQEKNEKTGAITGIYCTAKNKKNKVASPFRIAKYRLGFNAGPEGDAGIDMIAGFRDIALDQGLITKKGGWYQYGEQKFQERKWKEILRAAPDLMQAIIDSMGYEYPPESKMLNPFEDTLGKEVVAYEDEQED